MTASATTHPSRCRAEWFNETAILSELRDRGFIASTDSGVRKYGKPCKVTVTMAVLLLGAKPAKLDAQTF